MAAANRATKCAEALAPLLSSVNVADRTGRTALHHAVHSGHIEVSPPLLHCLEAVSGSGGPQRQPFVASPLALGAVRAPRTQQGGEEPDVPP